MDYLSVIYFFIVMYFLGFSVSYLIKKRSEKPVERNLIYLGIGLGTFPILAVILNIMHIMVHWAVFLLISLIIPAYSVFRKGPPKLKFPKFKLTKEFIYGLLVALFCVVIFVVYLKGSFTYPYLEDDDPWLHAAGATYVADFNTLSFDPALVNTEFNNYLEPYPPGFDALMGVLLQISGDVMWTLKFFNALIIALVGIFFYLFAKHFMDDSKKAVFATFVITVIPCFLSHFIWAAALAILLWFPFFYSILMLDKDWRWFFPAGIVCAGAIVTQMSNPFIMGLFFGVWLLVKAVSSWKVPWSALLAGAVGVALGFGLFWIPTVAKYGLETTFAGNSMTLGDISSISTKNAGGDVYYSWEDVIVAKTQSKMDNPIGIGAFLFWLTVFSIVVVLISFAQRPRIFAKEHSWQIVALLWTILAFIGIHGNRMPFPVLMPHRWWSILAIGIALLAPIGFFYLMTVSRRLKIPVLITALIIIVGIIITSGHPKYVVETSFWPPGTIWSSGDELAGYGSLSQLPEGSKVFPMCSLERKVLAYGMLAEPWDREYVAFKKSVFEKDPEDILAWLKSRGYQYLILDSSCVRDYGVNETNTMTQSLIATKKVTPAGNNQGFALFAI